MQRPSHSEIWVITSYYNPAKYRQRLINYRKFRESLHLPLLTIELGYGGNYELLEADAEIMVRVSSESILCQKERLLNIALERLPGHALIVVWLDCDILFKTENWPNEVAKKLQTHELVQVFSSVVRLTRGCLPNDLTSSDAVGRPSVAYSTKLRDRSDMADRLALFKTSTAGYGWAAKRRSLDGLGFYDAMITGGGDVVIACAALGWLQEAICAMHMDESRALHYLKWARPFFEKFAGKIDCVDCKVFHLWHGEVINRKYQQRHVDLALLGFNPLTDLQLNETGCWELSPDVARLSTHLRTYFIGRKEDG